MTQPDCRTQFTKRVLSDLGLCKGKVDDISDKLDISVSEYNNTKGQTTIGIIASDLYQCLKPTANDIARITANEINNTLLYILLATALFIFLIAIILTLLEKGIYYEWSILICILFGLLYIGLVVLLVYNTKNNISIIITDSENIAIDCINNAIDALTLYETQQQEAISDGLCAYTDTPVEC